MGRAHKYAREGGGEGARRKVVPRPYRVRSRRDRRLALFYCVNRNFWDCLFGFLFLRIFSCQDLCTWFHRPSRSYFYMASCAGCTSPRRPTPPSDPSQVPCATSRPMAKQRSCIITLNRKLNFSVQGPVYPRKLQEKQNCRVLFALFECGMGIATCLVVIIFVGAASPSSSRDTTYRNCFYGNNRVAC